MTRRIFLFVFVSILLIVVTFVLSACGKEFISAHPNNSAGRCDNEIDNPIELDSLAFSQEESDYIISGDTSEMMRVFLLYDFDDNGDTVSTYSDSIVLRSISRNVRPDSTDEVLMHLVYRMYKSMIDPEHPGVGIAAPQVGINRNVIWVERQDKPGNPAEVYFNPEIIQFGEQWLYGVEGCLSVPDKSGYVRRARAILLQYDDINGEQKTELIEAYTARIFQHEIDHLNGVMYIDHLDE